MENLPNPAVNGGDTSGDGGDISRSHPASGVVEVDGYGLRPIELATLRYDVRVAVVAAYD